MAVILNSAIIQPWFSHWFLLFAQRKTSLIQSDSTWWWQPSWILQWLDSDTAILDWESIVIFSLIHSKNTLHSILTLTQTNSIWLKLHDGIPSSIDDGSHIEFCHLGFSHFVQNSDSNSVTLDSNSFILTQLDDGSHLELCHFGFRHCHLGFRHLVIFCYLKNTLSHSSDSKIRLFKLIHSDLTWWWQPSWILPYWIQTYCHFGFRHLDIFSQINSKNTLLSSLTLTQTNSNLINLMMATMLNSAILDSAILHKTLTQTSSIWLKLIHSDSTWWWQASWNLPSWIQPFCTKKNFTHSFWLNLMMAAI